MILISKFIHGEPLCKKAGAARPRLKLWKAEVVQQTADLPAIEGKCIMRVTFVLTDEAFRTAPPYGPDLDNLLKPFLDALKQTILGPHGDSCIISVQATKAREGPGQIPGALLEILPIDG
jgi:Holliday junction resolvase RusA-like endonuclease